MSEKANGGRDGATSAPEASSGSFVADGHVHCYAVYDPRRAIEGLARNLAAWSSGGDVPVAFLTERHGERGFEQLPRLASGWGSVHALEAGLMSLRLHGGLDLYVVAGRQVSTSERLEVLGLCLEREWPDGRPLIETVQALREAGGIPVLTWAFGKWLGKRAAVLEAALERFRPGEILIGDTTLRPLGWPEPNLMRKAREAGYAILAGSDALPMSGEERFLGRYGSRWAKPAGEPLSLSLLRASLTRPGLRVQTLGRRCGPLAVAWRLARYRRRAGGGP